MKSNTSGSFKICQHCTQAEAASDQKQFEKGVKIMMKIFFSAQIGVNLSCVNHPVYSMND